MKPCPRDHWDLVPHQVKEHTVLHCPQCSGLWLTPEVVRAAAGHIPLPPANALTGPSCPEDQNHLVALHHQGVEIDICPVCGGVWLDRGELERILALRRPDKAGATNNTWDAFDVVDVLGDALGEVIAFVGECLISVLLDS